MQSIETDTISIPVSRQIIVSRRRSYLEILCEILQMLSKQPEEPIARHWRIISRCNLTWASSKPFLERLEAKRLIEIVAVKGFSGKAYRLTEDGFSFLQSYEAMMRKLFDESYVKGIWP